MLIFLGWLMQVKTFEYTLALTENNINLKTPQPFANWQLPQLKQGRVHAIAFGNEPGCIVTPC